MDSVSPDLPSSGEPGVPVAGIDVPKAERASVTLKVLMSSMEPRLFPCTISVIVCPPVPSANTPVLIAHALLERLSSAIPSTTAIGVDPMAAEWEIAMLPEVPPIRLAAEKKIFTERSLLPEPKGYREPVVDASTGRPLVGKDLAIVPLVINPEL